MFGRTNFHELNNSAVHTCKKFTHIIREISVTVQVAILFIENDSCKFVKFVGKKNPWFYTQFN